MGHRIGWSPEEVKSQLRTAAAETLSDYNDGWTQWMHKQHLWEIKFYIDDVLNQSPTFAGEQAWLKEQAKKHTWKLLNE